MGILEKARQRRSAALKSAPIFALGVALALAVAQTTPYIRIASWCDDLGQRIGAQPLPFNHVLVFDVDEESMVRLEMQLGPWPYKRDIYALVTGWLQRSGAQAVVFDILFSEAREGDDEFARMLDSRAVLAAAPLPYPLERRTNYHDQLRAQALSILPADDRVFLSWSDLTLPRSEFTPAGGARAGVIGVVPDADGTVRRVALLHESYGQVLPGLSLGALLAARGWPPVSIQNSQLVAGDGRWPVTGAGEILPRYPSNLQDQPIVPFYHLALAAAGVPQYQALAERVRGRIVFLGSSSAVLGDYVYTPFGRSSGLNFAALAAELLAEGRVSRPPSLAWDALLIALAVAFPLLAIARGPRSRPRDHAAGAAAALLLPVATGVGLLTMGQATHWPFSVLSGLLVQFLGVSRWQFELYRERQRLAFEALAAQNASRMKTEFLNQMTHELRTPVTAIMGFNRASQRAEDLSREERNYIATVIARNCEHMLSLVNNHLDLARIEAGQLSIELGPEDICAIAQQAVDTLRPAASEKGLAMALKLSRRPPALLMLDAVRMRQILLNLLGNAVKFTESGGVTLLLDWDGEVLNFTVADTGPGIPAEALKRVFEPFQQAGTSERAVGSGLGLAITRRLLEMMGGRIDVASTIGEGTQVTVRIPAAIAQTRPAVEAQAWVPAGFTGKVLVVEDSADLRELLRRQLSELGCEAVLAKDGLEAVSTASAAPFDFILMDMEMPRMNGDEARRALRARGYAGPIVAFTAHGRGMEVGGYREGDFDGVLAKPVSPEELAATLRRFCPPSSSTPAAEGHDFTPIVVHVNSVAPDLVPKFLDRCRADVAHIRGNIDGMEVDAICRIGHQLKGTGGSYGFPEITRLGAAIEVAAREGNREKLRDLADELERYVRRVKPVFS